VPKRAYLHGREEADAPDREHGVEGVCSAREKEKRNDRLIQTSEKPALALLSSGRDMRRQRRDSQTLLRVASLRCQMDLVTT
jgi:hypothetical protein